MNRSQPNKIKPLPKFVLKALTKCGISKPVAVPIRQKGLSSMGIAHFCHGNVCNMVLRYGGKRVSGYAVIKNPYCDEYQLIYHSIWLTPEGRKVCISKDSYANHGVSDDYVWFCESNVQAEGLEQIDLYNELYISRKTLEVKQIVLQEWEHVSANRAQKLLAQPVHTQHLPVELYNFLR